MKTKKNEWSWLNYNSTKNLTPTRHSNPNGTPNSLGRETQAKRVVMPSIHMQFWPQNQVALSLFLILTPACTWSYFAIGSWYIGDFEVRTVAVGWVVTQRPLTAIFPLHSATTLEPRGFPFKRWVKRPRGSKWGGAGHRQSGRRSLLCSCYDVCNVSEVGWQEDASAAV